MAPVIFILAAVMALFAVLGYVFGSTSALLLLIVIIVGLLVIANAGGKIITLINAIYRLLVAGGIGALSSGGDLTALKNRMNAVQPLIPSDASGAVLLLILIVVILLAILLGRHRRFRRPPSGLGLLFGLANGYLVGAYLLTQMLPSVGTILPLPFGLGPKVAGTAAAGAAATTNFGAQLLAAVGAANMTSRNLVASIVIAGIILAALFVNLRGRGGGAGGRSRNGARDRD